MTTAEPQSVWDLAAELGEGPVWVERDAALWFTDIKRQKIHRLVPATGDKRSWDAPEQVGFALPASRGGFVVGLQSGLHHFDEATGEFKLIAQIDALIPTNRLNDAVTDQQGRLWFGTMDNGEAAATGSFYCFRNGETISTGISGISITNGPAISPDGRTLYHVDTLGGTIGCCEILSDGSLGPSKPFVRISPEEGHPDGPTVDAEGCVWVGLYAGWEARRYSPAGEWLSKVRFPVANVTKIAFGGADLRTIYATTAKQLLSAEELQRQPQAGNLFSFQAEVRGLPTTPVAY